MSSIPIKNIYYMLCYAWNTLEQVDNLSLGTEKFDNIYNLFARIYIQGTNRLIKRGLNKYYIEESEELSTLRGKINITNSMKKQTFRNGRMICQYDNFSVDIILNQIIKTTINILGKKSDLDKELREKLFSLKPYFSEIQEIQLSNKLFSILKYNRNNHHYRMMIHISELLYKELITMDDNGEMIFSDFNRNEQMAALYEKFVFNFYKIHLDRKKYKVYAPRLHWDVEKESVDIEDERLLPEMRTDIVIDDRMNNTQLIIDTKFYAQTLISSNYSTIEKIRTSHLYQILTYVQSSKYEGLKKGLLLYPTVEKEIDANYIISGKNISIKTLNLHVEWIDIEQKLLSLMEN